jgi:uncharacterized membrane protein (UPF0127 family)
MHFVFLTQLARKNTIFIIVFLVTLFALLASQLPVMKKNSEDLLYKKYFIQKSNGTTLPLFLTEAKTERDRSKGLMYTEHLKPTHGMIFIFSHPQVVSFWMKNTPISLDLIMLDEDGIIQEIFYNTLPNSTRSITSNTLIKFVVEINAGETKKFNIERGDLLLKDDKW